MITHRTAVFAIFTLVIALRFVVVEVSPYVLDKRIHACASFHNWQFNTGNGAYGSLRTAFGWMER